MTTTLVSRKRRPIVSPYHGPLLVIPVSEVGPRKMGDHLVPPEQQQKSSPNYNSNIKVL